MFWPVTNRDACGGASQTTAPASSSASPNRPIGVWPTIDWPRSVYVPSSLQQHPPVLLGREEAGGDRVDAHALRRPLAGQALRQVEHRRLRRRVGHHPRQREDRRHRRDVDDAALARPRPSSRRTPGTAAARRRRGSGRNRLPAVERDAFERGCSGVTVTLGRSRRRR